MTVSKINPVNNYAGDSSVTRFDFDFLIEDEKELLVQHTDSSGIQRTLTLDVDYSINEVGNKNGSYITFPLEGSEYSVLGTDEVISLSLELDIEQDKEYANSSKLNLTTLEWSFDYIVRILQTMSRKIARSVKVQEGSTQTADDLIEALQEAQINASNSAAAAATSETNAQNYAISAGEEATIATQKVVELEELYTEASEDITTKHTEATEDIEADRQAALGDIESSKSAAINIIETTKTNAKNNIQALGIYMEDNRLFYYTPDGVKHEFRNDFGGIAPMSIYNKDIQKVETGFALRWSDPNDSTYMDNVYCNWGGTLIVRKENSFPESPFDGSVILDCKTRNAYSADAYIDVCDNTKNYKYRAFPYSINKVYNLDDKNKFGVWIFGFTELLTEPDPAKRITYIEDNEYYSPQYMDFANDIFRYGDWENSPFNHYDWIRPVTLYNSLATDENGNNLDGQVFEYLDPNDHTKTIDGEVSHIADLSMNINCMVEKRKIFYKRTWEGNYYIFRASNEKLEGYECLNCLKADGTYNEFYYTPMYGGYLHNNVLRSMSGGLAAMSGKTGAQEWSYARANGADWFGELEVDEKLEEDIFKLLFKNTNSQAVLGNGVIDSSNALSGSGVSGRTDQKGPNYGTNGTNFPVKFRYRQNFYSYQWKRIGGHIVKNGVHYFKYTKHTGDGSTANDWDITGTTANGYVAAPEIPAPSGTSGGYQSGFKATKWGVFPTVHSGSSTTYTGDGGWFNNGIVAVVVRGGASTYGALCGAFCSDSADAVSSASWGVGCSVSYRAS